MPLGKEVQILRQAYNNLCNYIAKVERENKYWEKQEAGELDSDDDISVSTHDTDRPRWRSTLAR